MEEECEAMDIAGGGNRLYSLHFADDQVILAEDESGLLCTLGGRNYKSWGITINPSKTVNYLVAVNSGRKQLSAWRN